MEVMSKVGAYGHKEEKIARFDLYVILLCKVNTLFILVVSQVFQKGKKKKRASLKSDILVGKYHMIG